MFKKTLYIFFIFLFLLSCSKKNKIQKPEKLPSENILYSTAIDYYEKGKWSESIQLLNKIEINYAFSDYAPKATLMIIYIYYESGELVKTLENAKRFKKNYPSHKNLDYVDYIIGLSMYEEINTGSKDPTNARLALKQFKKIQKIYPKSVYSDDIKNKIFVINEQLASKEMYIARYYMERSRWLSAIKRLKRILDNYENTVYVKEALHRLVEIYYKLGNITEAKKYASILGYNFNDSDWYKKSYKIIVDKNYEIEKKNSRKSLKEKIIKLLKFSL